MILSKRHSGLTPDHRPSDMPNKWIKSVNIMYCGPSAKDWIVLFVFIIIIGLCLLFVRRCGQLMIIVTPFMFVSILGVILFCLDFLKPFYRTRLKWQGFAWYLLLFFASWSTFIVYVFHL